MVVAGNDKPEQHLRQTQEQLFVIKQSPTYFIYNIYPIRVPNLSNPRAEDCQWS